MLLGLVGGGLQGLEAAYLAGKAGWRVRLLDRRAEAPARGLVQDFVQGDAADPRVLERALAGVDLVLPALEDAPVLQGLSRWAGERGLPLAFDPAAYAVSSSKLASNGLFRRLGLEVPRDGPGCGFPLLAKPDGSSGSRGVRLFRQEAAWRAWREEPRDPQAWVLQEYLEGPSYSIEVLGLPGAHRALQVTALDMDAGWDCKRVRAPAALAGEQARELERMAVALAAALGLRGLMDLEVILHGGRLKLLEIDARLPSQTPIAVYWSTGYNMVEALGGLFRDPRGGGPPPLPPARRAALLEHVRAAGGRLEVCGEHVLVRRGGLRVEPGFFGAEEAITDYSPRRSDWAATLLVTGVDEAQAWRRRGEVLRAICGACGLGEILDPEPPR